MGILWVIFARHQGGSMVADFCWYHYFILCGLCRPRPAIMWSWYISLSKCLLVV